MLTKEEKDFIRYWEANRLRRKKVFRQLLIGIPAGLLITVPIVINLAAGWDKRATMEANSSDFNPMVLIVALLLIVGFSAIFWQRHQWDQYEQRYIELLTRQQREEGRGDAGPAIVDRGEGASRSEAADEVGAKKSPGDHQGS